MPTDEAQRQNVLPNDCVGDNKQKIIMPIQTKSITIENLFTFKSKSSIIRALLSTPLYIYL